jgi:hypothetical protein
MKSFAAALSLATIGQASLSTLSRLDKEKQVLGVAEFDVAKGKAYELVLPLGKGTEFIQFTMKSYDSSCSWAYMHPETETPIPLTDVLGACDFPIRQITTKQMTTIMPISRIPDFDQADAVLLLSCQASKTTLKKAKYGCSKTQDAAGVAAVDRGFFNFGPYWWIEGASYSQADLITHASVFWTLTAIDWGFFGSQYCVNLFVDMAEFAYYTWATELSMDIDNPMLWLFLAQMFNFALQGSADGYQCISNGISGTWWSSSGNAWAWFFSGSAAFSYDWWPDLAYTMAFLIQATVTAFYAEVHPLFIWIEAPRTVVALWKMIYAMLSPVM